jgi:hypothetical protein
MPAENNWPCRRFGSTVKGPETRLPTVVVPSTHKSGELPHNSPVISPNGELLSPLIVQTRSLVGST